MYILLLTVYQITVTRATKDQLDQRPVTTHMFSISTLTYHIREWLNSTHYHHSLPHMSTQHWVVNMMLISLNAQVIGPLHSLLIAVPATQTVSLIQVKILQQLPMLLPHSDPTQFHYQWEVSTELLVLH